MVCDLERSLLELVSLKKLRRFLTTPQQTDLHDLALIGWTERQSQSRGLLSLSYKLVSRLRL